MTILSGAGREAVPARTPSVGLRILGVVILLGISVYALIVGLELRRTVWDKTMSVRFLGDVSNGYSWGMIASRVGLFVTYDAVQAGQGRNFIDQRLDYTPLRLTVVTIWANWARTNYPGDKQWRNDYDLTAPMLHFNTVCEWMAAVLAFFIIRLWIVRMSDAQRGPLEEPRPFRGVVPAMIGALVLWFNPAVIWDGHAWPQWDVWLVPFFLAAVLLVSLDWWFAAGACIVIGANLKGQMLLGAPILLLLPLMRLDFSALLRLISGCALAGAIIWLPWMRPGNAAMLWLMLSIVAAGLLQWVIWRGKTWSPKWIAILVITSILLSWPWASSVPWLQRLAPLGVLALIGLTAILPSRLLPSILALCIAGFVFLMIPLFSASTSWYTYGFDRASMQYSNMLAGNGLYNIPEMLRFYGNRVTSPDQRIEIYSGTLVTYRQLAGGIHIICLVLLAIAGAIQWRRKDSRFLITMVAPFILAYLILPQMHGRYLIWGAAMSSLLFGASFGLGLLGLIVSGIALLGMAQNQYTFDRNWDPNGYRTMLQINPHLGWVLILIALILLYVAFLPRPRPKVIVEEPLAPTPYPPGI